MIAFWRDAGPKRWFASDPEFDRLLTDRFGATHLAASRGELHAWEDTPTGALALLILTDQFSRNLYRGSAHAFATDAMARAVTGRALSHGFDQETDVMMRQFFYLPFQHHENVAAQARSLELYARLTADGGDKSGLTYAKIHADIITRFGRFPHRNAVMGRVSTPEEIAFLADGGFAG